MSRHNFVYIIGFLLLSSGVAWEIGETYPDIFKNIILNIVFPPTYRILETTGILLVLIGTWDYLKCVKEKTEQE